MAKLRQMTQFLLVFQLLTSAIGHKWTYTFFNSRIIQAPTYFPSSRSKSESTTWLLTAQPRKMVKLEFLEFQLQERHAVLHIYEGAQLKKLYAKYTGNTRPPVLFLQSNQVALFLYNNGTMVDRRFKIRFTSYAPDMPSANTRTLLYYGNILTPNYPSMYPNNSRITWHLRGQVFKAVQLQINDFVLDSAGDTLSVYEVNRSSQRLHSRFTGVTKPSTISLRSSEAVLVFNSDDTRTARGFNITFKTYFLPIQRSQSTAGGYSVAYMLASPAELRTPNYPNPYDNNVTISWYLTAGIFKRVQLQFKDFQLADGHDFLSIYEGHLLLKAHSRYTGYVEARNITLGSNYAILVFQSDNSVVSQGFSIGSVSYTLPTATRAIASSTPGYEVSTKQLNLTDSRGTQWHSIAAL